MQSSFTDLVAADDQLPDAARLEWIYTENRALIEMIARLYDACADLYVMVRCGEGFTFACEADYARLLQALRPIRDRSAGPPPNEDAVTRAILAGLDPWEPEP